MREIKFRGRTPEGQWVYGDLTHERWPLDDYNDDERVCVGGHEVMEQSVGEFAGLCDKDGKEIYEGDVVAIQHVGLAIVGWCHGASTIKGDGITVGRLAGFTELITIIGNVYDTPELFNPS